MKFVISPGLDLGPEEFDIGTIPVAHVAHLP